VRNVGSQCLGAALLAVCLLSTGCGLKGVLNSHGDPPSPVHSAAYEGGVLLADPADGIWLTAPAGTDQLTDPTLIANALTGVADSGPPPSDFRLLGLKVNPHSYYYKSAVELYVDATTSTTDTLIAAYPQFENALKSSGGYNFRRQIVTVHGTEAERVDYVMKYDAEPHQITRLLMVRNGKLDLVLVSTDGISPEPTLADGIVASIVLG
jgi:hypothetical protein